MTAPGFELTSQRQKVSRLPTEPPARPCERANIRLRTYIWTGFLVTITKSLVSTADPPLKKHTHTKKIYYAVISVKIEIRMQKTTKKVFDYLSISITQIKQKEENAYLTLQARVPLEPQRSLCYHFQAHYFRAPSGQLPGCLTGTRIPHTLTLW